MPQMWVTHVWRSSYAKGFKIISFLSLIVGDTMEMGEAGARISPLGREGEIDETDLCYYCI